MEYFDKTLCAVAFRHVPQTIQHYCASIIRLSLHWITTAFMPSSINAVVKQLWPHGRLARTCCWYFVRR